MSTFPTGSPAGLPILGVDFETTSACDLKSAGAWNYAQDDSTRILCAVFGLQAHRDGPIRIQRWTPDQDLEPWVREHIILERPVLAHNCAFERSILAFVPEIGLLVPPIRTGQWRDTMALAAAANLPGSLERIAQVLGLPDAKDMEGHALMLRLCRATRHDDGSVTYPECSREDLERLQLYCERDVRATLGAWWRLPPMPIREQLVFAAHLAINERGVRVDGTRVRAMAEMARKRARQLQADALELNLDTIDVLSASRLKAYVLEMGNVRLPVKPRKRKDGTVVETVCLDRKAIEKLLLDPNLDPVLRGLFDLRRESGKVASLSKLGRVAQLIDRRDLRLRHSFRFCGAITGRWASYGVQLHNMPRDRFAKKGGEYVSSAIDECIERADVDTLGCVVAQPLEALSARLRSILVPRPGVSLFGADYSAIEARGLAWLAGESGVLGTFARGEDIYMADARTIDTDDRQMGKLCRLGLGYGMGPVKFVVTAADNGVRLSMKRAVEVVKAWRAANPRIVALWRALDDGVREAVLNPGVPVEVAEGRLRLAANKTVLVMLLPSGRAIRYWRPHIVRTKKRIEVADDDGQVKVREMEVDEVRYFTANGEDDDAGGGEMKLRSGYGGKWTENAVQALCRDLLGDALVRLEGPDSPFDTVAHVHDSIAAEPRGRCRPRKEQFAEIVTQVPDWAAGFPVAAEAYEAPRFKG